MICRIKVLICPMTHDWSQSVLQGIAMATTVEKGTNFHLHPIMIRWGIERQH